MLRLLIIMENGIYPQECFAAFIGGVKKVQGEGAVGGSTEIFEINLLRTWARLFKASLA